MKLNRLLSLFAICVCLGIVGIPTAVHPTAPAIIDVHALAPASNDLGASSMGAGFHNVCIQGGQTCGGIETSGLELNPDPCAVAFGDSYMTGDILYGTGSPVSILDKWHSCQWNPWN